LRHRVHGDEDQIVPIGISSAKSAKMIESARIEIVKGAPHGMRSTQKDKISASLLSFIRG